jgi:hypothetical protein
MEQFMNFTRQTILSWAFFTLTLGFSHTSIMPKPLSYSQALELGEQLLRNHGKQDYEYFLERFKVQLLQKIKNTIDDSQIASMIKAITEQPPVRRVPSRQSAAATAAAGSGMDAPPQTQRPSRNAFQLQRAFSAAHYRASSTVQADVKRKVSPDVQAVTPENVLLAQALSRSANVTHPTVRHAPAAATSFQPVVPPLEVRLVSPTAQTNKDEADQFESNKKIALAILNDKRGYKEARKRWNSAHRVDIRELGIASNDSNKSPYFLIIQDFNNPFEFAELQFIQLTLDQSNTLSTYDEAHWADFLTGFRNINNENVFYLYRFYQFKGFRDHIEKLPGFQKSIVTLKDKIEESQSTKEKTFFSMLQSIPTGQLEVRAPAHQQLSFFGKAWNSILTHLTPSTAFSNHSAITYIVTQNEYFEKYDPQYAELKKQYALEKQQRELALLKAQQTLRMRQLPEITKLQRELKDRSEISRTLLAHLKVEAESAGGLESCKPVTLNGIRNAEKTQKMIKDRLEALAKAERENYGLDFIQSSTSFDKYKQVKRLMVGHNWTMDIDSFIGDAIQRNQYNQLIEQLCAVAQTNAQLADNQFGKTVVAHSVAHSAQAAQLLRAGHVAETYSQIDYASLFNSYARSSHKLRDDYALHFVDNAQSFATMLENFDTELKENSEYIDHAQKELTTNGCVKQCRSECVNLEHSVMRGNLAYAERLRSNIRSIRETYSIENPHEIRIQPYAITDSAKRLYQNANYLMDSQELLFCCGNAMQRQAHQDVVDLLNRTAHFADSNSTDNEVTDFVRDLARIARLGLSAAKHNHVLIAWDIINAGNTLLEYAAISTARVAAQKLVSAGATVFDVVVHPVRTAHDLCNAVRTLYGVAFDHDLYEYTGDFSSIYQLVNDPELIKHYEALIDLYRKRGLTDLEIEIQIARSIKFNTRVEALGNYVQQMGIDILGMTFPELHAAGVDFMLDYFLWSKMIGIMSKAVAPAKEALARAGNKLIPKGGKITATEVATALGEAEVAAAQLPAVVEQTEGFLVNMVAEAQATQEAVALGEAAIKALPKISLAGYHRTLGNLRTLEEAANMFKNIKGALTADRNGPLDRLLRLGLQSSSVGDLNVSRGSAFELLKALDLTKKGKKVVSFGTKYPKIDKLTGKLVRHLEVDIETATHFIECKNWNWASKTERDISALQSTLGDLYEAAIANGKILELHVKNSPPDALKNWLIKKKIPLIEG